MVAGLQNGSRILRRSEKGLGGAFEKMIKDV